MKKSTRTPSASESLEEEEHERKSVEEAEALSPKLIYEVIRREGEAEMARPANSLIWSGIAAGMMISFSVLGEAIMRTYLPDAPFSFLIENLGYSLGFLLVILGRMQLFTENTITTVLPVMAKPGYPMFYAAARVWTIVLAANLVGAVLAALMMAYTSAVPADLIPAVTELSLHSTSMSAKESFFRAIPAGVLVAAIVWMLPQAESQSFFVILVFTWLIAAGDFLHVVAGAVEMAFLMFSGSLGFSDAAFGFFLPVLAGNITGGTVIFALLAWGQVKDELRK